MSRINELKQLINKHNRRLQILKQQKAQKGLNTPPEIITEIEDIEAELEGLQVELLEKVLSTEASDNSRNVDYQKKALTPLPIVLLVILLLIISAGVGYFMATVMSGEPSSISLVGLRYRTDWDSRLVDLRTVSDSGIPVESGQRLRFFDIWVSVPKNVSDDYERIQARIYIAGTEQVIGFTDMSFLDAEVVQLGDVTITSFNHGQYPDSWRIQEDWTDLQFVFVVYGDNANATLGHANIHLDPEGTAWLFDPPNLNFASVVYTVNDGPAYVLDLRNIDETGIAAAPGDTLALLEIWYRSNVKGQSNDRVTVEAYLGRSGFDSDTFEVAGSDLIEKGVHKLTNISSFRWTIPDNREFLGLNLIREGEAAERAMMDVLIVPLDSHVNSGLIPSTETILR
jgi:hypothetical protein